MQDLTGDKAVPCPLAVEQQTPQLDSDPFSVVRRLKAGLASG